jgi:hypothetical protein
MLTSLPRFDPKGLPSSQKLEFFLRKSAETSGSKDGTAHLEASVALTAET